MLNKIGRLTNSDKNEIRAILDDVFKLLDADKKEKARKKIYELSKTQNYFIRKFLGKELLNYHDQRKIVPLVKKMLDNKYYGIRASALFYFFDRYRQEPEKLLEILDEHYDSAPWEAETIINELWKKYPEIMKEHMEKWIESDDKSKRAISFHGMENIANKDPQYIMNFLAKAIDDNALEVQKKITHILTQVARSKPIIAFPVIREWLTDADDRRVKTIWVSMKKLANIISQSNKRNQKNDFVILTEQTIKDWAKDENKKVAKMGKKLLYIIKQNKH